MKKSKPTYSADFKAQVVLEVLEGNKSPLQIATEGTVAKFGLPGFHGNMAHENWKQI